MPSADAIATAPGWTDVDSRLRGCLMSYFPKYRDAVKFLAGSEHKSIDVENLRSRGALIGTPEQIVEAMGRFAEAGVQRLMAQWIIMDDIDGLELLASRVLPQLR